MTGTRATPRCPYVGLQPYTEADVDLFYGRQRDQRVIAANLYAASLTVLYGASGVGKSSILLAGVVPHLRAQPRTVVVVFREWQGAGFLDDLKASCLGAAARVLGSTPALDRAAPLDELAKAVAEAVKGSVLFILDQFEEYFVYHPPSETGDTFDAEFARTVNRDDVDAAFLVCLREDGLARLDRFRTRIPTLLSNTLRLHHLDASGAEEAIREPLKVFNASVAGVEPPVTVEDELVHAVIEQVSTGEVLLSGTGGVGQAQAGDGAVRIEAPFLQLVMTRVWEEERRADSPNLRATTLQRLGGAREIVRTHLDGVMSTLDARQQELCSRFFDRLVTPSGTKIACALGDLTDWAGALSTEVRPVLDALGERRILRSVANPDPLRAAEPCYEVYHDVLAAAVLNWRSTYVQVQSKAEAERRAEQQRLRAEEQTKIAARMRRLSVVSMILVVCLFGFLLWTRHLRRRALANAMLATSGELTAAATGSLAVDPDRSLALALQAIRATSDASTTVTPEATNAARQVAMDAVRHVLATSRLQTTLVSDGGRLHGVAFSASGNQLATAGDNGATVWDTTPGREPVHLPREQVNAVAYGPRGDTLITAGKDGAAIWNVASSALLSTLGDLCTVSGVVAVAYSRDGSRVATATSREDTVRIWDTATGHEARVPLSLLNQWFAGVAFDPSGRRLAAAGINHEYSPVWDLASGQVRFLLPADAGLINAVAFSPDGKLLATAGRDRVVRLWNVETDVPAQILALYGHSDQVRSVAFDNEGTHLATGGADRLAKVWDVRTGRQLFSLAAHTGWVNGVAFSPDGSRLATVSRDRSTRIWDVAGHTDAVDGIAVSRDGRRLATASADGTAKLWELPSMRYLATLAGHGDVVYRVAFAPDGARVATASFDKTAAVWDATTGQLLQTFGGVDGHTDGLRDVAFSSDGKLLATASADTTAKVWEVATAHVVTTVHHDNQVQGVAFDRDNRLITASWDHTIRVWNATTGKRLEPTFPTKKELWFNNVAVSPDGKLLASASNEHDVLLWDAASGKLLLPPLKGHAGAVRAVAFSADGRRLVTASEDRTAKVWDVREKKVLFTIALHTDVVNDVAFGPDGNHLATAGNDGTFQFSPLDDEDELIDLARRHMSRRLTPEECQKYLHVERCPEALSPLPPVGSRETRTVEASP